MNEKIILDQLTDIAGKSEKRMDTFLTNMQAFLKDSPEWDDKHEVIFEQMEKEVKNTRVIRNFALGGVGLLILLLVATWFLDRRSAAEEALIKSAMNESLPLRFDASLDPKGLTLSILPDATFNVKDEEEQERVKKIVEEFPLLGKHNSLGREQTLDMRRLSGRLFNEWVVLPRGSSEKEVLGKVTIDPRYARIDYRQQYGADGELLRLAQSVKIDEVVQYDDYADAPPLFYVKVDSFAGVDPHVEWEVRFGEEPKEGGDITWDDDPIMVHQSPGGLIKDRPRAVQHPSWSGIYVVQIGLGKLGVDDLAWNLNSHVYRISFQ